MYFLCILEIDTNFRNFKRKWKTENSRTVTGRPFGPRPCRLSLAEPGFWPIVRCMARTLTAWSSCPRAVRWRSRHRLASGQGVAGEAARALGRQWQHASQGGGGRGSPMNYVDGEGRGAEAAAQFCSEAAGELWWPAMRATGSCSTRGATGSESSPWRGEIAAAASVSRGGGDTPVAWHQQEVKEGVGGARDLLEKEKGWEKRLVAMERRPF
jgi:hypothetical protein